MGAIFTKIVEKSGEIGIFFATKSRAIVGQNYFKMLSRALLTESGWAWHPNLKEPPGPGTGWEINAVTVTACLGPSDVTVTASESYSEPEPARKHVLLQNKMNFQK